MNKQFVENYTVKAYELMRQAPPNKGGSIRAQISTLGAAVSSGSLLSAIAFFSASSGEKKDDVKDEAKKIRLYLLGIIYDILKDSKKPSGADEKGRLFDYVIAEIQAGREYEVTDKILSAAIAVKLALNLFPNENPKQS